MSGAPVGIAIATRDRRELLLATLAHLTTLPGAPPIVVADDRSTDGTAAAVSDHFPQVTVIAARGRGAAARNEAVAALDTPLVAFADDDSWWARDALTRAAAHFDRTPRLGLLAARVLVGPEQRLDPVCAAMRVSPLGAAPELPGPRLLGFVACGAVVRRDAFLGVGGFHPRYGVGGEEELLALDLRAAGWALAYADDVVAHHHPAAGPRHGRTRVQHRNALWSAWLRRPAGAALRATAATARTDPRATAAALAGLPWALRERRTITDAVEAEVQLVERAAAKY